MRPACGLLLAAAACTGGDKDPKEPADEVTVTVLSITTAGELVSAENQLVRVHGPVFHEKLGDGIELDGITVLCPDLRLPDGTAEVSLQGRLELWEEPAAEVNEAGEISQGVDEPTSRWILRDCKQV